MKTLQNIGKTIVLAASILLTASCHKDDNPVTPAAITNNPNNSFVSAKVDGADFTSYIFGTSAASCSRGGTGSDQFVTVLGGNLAGNSITVYIQGNLAVGTYNVHKDSVSFLNYSTGSGDNAYSTENCEAASGTIVVTASDATHIEGTFSFIGRDTDNCSASKTITQGSFKGIYSN